MRKKSFLSIFIFFICLFIGSSILIKKDVLAQLPSNVGDKLIMEVIPPSPSPGDEVRVEVESYTTDLRQASISWIVNGETKQQEIGNQLYTFVAPEAGKRVQVEVVVTQQNGVTYSDTVFVEPNNIDVIIEGITYTPPMYQGRPMFTHQSRVNIGVIPTLIENGKQLKPNEIFFGWEVNGTYYRDLSGVGRDNIIYTGALVSRPITIDVTVQNLNGTLKARKIIVLEPEDPRLLLYENNPLQGVLFEKSLLGEFKLEREDITLSAIPFFFDAEKKDDINLNYVWGENGKRVSGNLASNELSFRNESLKQSGVSKITVQTDHLDKLFQDASTGFTLNVIGNNQINTENDDEITVF